MQIEVMEGKAVRSTIGVADKQQGIILYWELAKKLREQNSALSVRTKTK